MAPKLNGAYLASIGTVLAILIPTLAVGGWVTRQEINVASNTDANTKQDTVDERLTRLLEAQQARMDKQETDAEMLRRHEEFCHKHNLTPKQCADY